MDGPPLCYLDRLSLYLDKGSIRQFLGPYLSLFLWGEDGGG